MREEVICCQEEAKALALDQRVPQGGAWDPMAALPASKKLRITAPEPGEAEGGAVRQADGGETPREPPALTELAQMAALPLDNWQTTMPQV